MYDKFNTCTINDGMLVYNPKKNAAEANNSCKITKKLKKIRKWCLFQN